MSKKLDVNGSADQEDGARDVGATSISGRASPERALELVGPGSRVVASPGCGTPTTLLDHLARRSAEVSGLHLLSGLLIGEHPFVEAVTSGTLAYTTWHATSATRRLVAEGHAHTMPIRLSQVERTLDRIGVDVALVRVSPPSDDGTVSLGPSMTYGLAAVERARIVIGEIDERLPTTAGPTRVAVDRFDALVASTAPTPVHPTAEPDPVSRAIARHVIDLLPERPVLQLGLGRVPEALVGMLGAADLGPLRFAGMGIDGMVDLAETGRLAPVDPVADHGALCAVELMGSARLMRFADRNPTVTVHPSREGHDPGWLARRFDRFVSVNSAVEVDLEGQVSSEFLLGRQISGIGGSADFADAARLSRGGLAVVALPSTARDGASRIVARLPATSVVTLPRHAYDVLVTEHGAADLRGLDARSRVEAIVGVAHPDHRDRLWEEWVSLQRPTGNER